MSLLGRFWRRGQRRPKIYGKGAVRYRFPEGAQGPIQLTIDYGKAPLPESYYYADTVSLRRDLDLAMVILSFGQTNDNAAKLRDRVDIAMPEGTLFGQFWRSIQASVQSTVEKQVKDLRRKPIGHMPARDAAEAVTLYANHIFCSTGGGESCLDFYYFSPRDIHLAKMQHSEIALVPIIRVTMSPILLKYMFDLCRPDIAERSAEEEVSERQSHATVHE